MLEHRRESLAGKVCTVSGSGNVAIYTVEKAMQLGAKVVTMSDSDGFVYDRDGFTQEKLDFVKDLKEVRRGRIKRVRRRVQVRVPRRQTAVGRALPGGVPERHAERDR